MTTEREFARMFEEARVDLAKERIAGIATSMASFIAEIDSDSRNVAAYIEQRLQPLLGPSLVDIRVSNALDSIGTDGRKLILSAPESTSEGAQKVREEAAVPGESLSGASKGSGAESPALPPHRDSTAVGEPRVCATCGHPPEAHIYNEGECHPGFTCPCGRFAPTPEPATATGSVRMTAEQFEQFKANHAAATGSGEAKCDRCFNRYPVLFSMCRPCMDEVAPPSIQPPGDGEGARAKVRAEVLAEAVMSLEVLAVKNKDGGTHGETFRHGIRAAASHLRDRIARLAAIPDGGAAKGTGK